MSTYFSKIIKAGERQREFNFRQVQSDGELVYHVDVPDDRGVRVYFHMVRTNEGHWKPVTQTLPKWVETAESELDTVIREEQRA